MIATVFDTETTGLIINPARKLDTQPEIISLAMQSLIVPSGELQVSYYKVFKPKKPIPEEITKITGFTNDSVSGAPPIKDHLDDIIVFLETSELIIGQNLGFDMSMIELECQRDNRRIKWPRKLDLVASTIHLKGYRLSLKNLHTELFGVAFEDSHTADADVAATVRCTVELYKRGLL